MPCGHVNIPAMSEALDNTAEALADMATPDPVSRGQMLSMTLPDEHSCTYADDTFAGATLIDGELEGSRGFVDTHDVLLADLDGDAVGDGLAHLICSSGVGGTTSALEALLARSGRVLEIPYGEDAQRVLGDLSVYRPYGVQVSSGQLRLRASGHRPDDAVCCPSDEVDILYRLGKGGPTFLEAKLLTTPPPETQPEGCSADALVRSLCDFVTAVQTGDWGQLTEAEKEVAAETKDLPSREWEVGTCELEGDVTARCEVIFPVSEEGSEDTVATFYVQPTEVEFGESGVVPAGDDYGVVSYEGLGL